jgi:hypothetical protein
VTMRMCAPYPEAEEMSGISKRYQYTLWTGMYLEQEAEVLGSVRARAARPVLQLAALGRSLLS